MKDWVSIAFGVPWGLVDAIIFVWYRFSDRKQIKLIQKPELKMKGEGS